MCVIRGIGAVFFFTILYVAPGQDELNTHLHFSKTIPHIVGLTNSSHQTWSICGKTDLISLMISWHGNALHVTGPLPWWRHQMETFSALLAICAGNSPVPGEFPTQRPVTRSFDVYFDLRPNKRLSKQSWIWWFEMLSCSLWRHRNGDSDPPFTSASFTSGFPHRLWYFLWC